ncbi:hybrid sensor histidine kinase/response regulator [Anaerolineales bacterium HSG6]|nr:hybrid sensor histidine kinase/response regulator [Anaerolineales bacterium HSG6]
MNIKSQMLPDFEADTETHTILIIDDSPTNLGVLADYLEDYDFDILVAEDGESGLDKAQYALPDLILLDVMMPGMDGFEACRHLKKDERTKDIPVIFMTALAETEHKVKGFASGAVDYVTKPLHQEEVLARIHTHLKISDLTNNLQAANQELSKLNADKDKFMSIMAHDLKGPFLPLLGMSELLPRLIEVDAYDKVQEMSFGIHRAAQNVYNLLENLLQWSRLQMGRMDYKPEKVNLTEIISRNTQLLEEGAFYKKITLKSHLYRPIYVFVDEYMLDTTVRNLMSNALKFTPSGGHVTILTTLIENDHQSETNGVEQDFIELSVIDTGVGINEKDMKKLFRLDEHHTTMGTASEQGTGLGLIMCQEMIRQNGGDISVESKVGKGTTFKITIPLDQSVSAEMIDIISADAPDISSMHPALVQDDSLPKLVPPPLSYLEKLLDLATIGNMYALEEVAREIAALGTEYEPFARHFQELAKSFEDEEILLLLGRFILQQ